MLAILTKYLFQYRRVCIPHIGTFEILQHSPQLRVADQMMTAPYYKTVYSKQDVVPDHQYLFFGCSDELGKEQVKKDLVSFGQELKNKIQQAPFKWEGVGTLTYSSNELFFEPEHPVLHSLQKVPAEKVIRHNVAHHMLVGDQETTTQQMTEVLHKSIYKKPMLLFGWILVFVALSAVILILYIGNFQVNATGLKMK